jgi:hypothetical protein
MSSGMGFARFMELRGYRVVEHAGTLWHAAGFGMYMSFPYHRRLDLDPAEAGGVVRAIRAFGIRYPSLRWGGMPSGLYVCRNKQYDVESLHRNFRVHVRKGLPQWEIRTVNEEELLTQALAINRETMKRQKRFDAEFGDAARWSRFVEAIQKSPCISAVGAFVSSRLGCYAITCLEDGWLEVLYKMSSFEFDHLHPCQVLDYHLTRRVATDASVDAVSMGWAPLVALQGLHDYKVRMGYTFEPQASVIRLRPSAEVLLHNRFSLRALRFAQENFPDSQRLARVCAVLDGARQAKNGHSPKLVEA